MKKINLQDWKKWVQSDEESHFFFFCDEHEPFVFRADVDALSSFTDVHSCDYPDCHNKATVEYFPNLCTIVGERLKDAEFNRFYQIDPVTNKFVKVKNYGKRVQPKVVSKKRSKKAKLPLPGKKRSNKTS